MSGARSNLPARRRQWLSQFRTECLQRDVSAYRHRLAFDLDAASTATLPVAAAIARAEIQRRTGISLPWCVEEPE